MDAPTRRELNKGFGDGLSRAFELALTPAVFAALGFLIDRLVGTTLVFTLGVFALAVVGMGIREWYAYDAAMREHEAAFALRRQGGGQ